MLQEQSASIANKVKDSINKSNSQLKTTFVG